MSNRQELERDITALEKQIAGISDLIAGLDGSAPVTGPDPKTIRQSLIAKWANLKSQLRAPED
jgi:hypothetical protein